MSFVFVLPDVIAGAAADAAGVGHAVGTASAAAAGATTGVLAAADDEVSAAIAALFSSHGHQYQAFHAEAAAFHDRFVRALSGAGGAYGWAEAASAGPLQAFEE
ncbi:MAG: PE family protein, partial [Mycobacterium gordonae]|nr:PE family protein [Mycobacterium gordonae]